MNDTRPDLGVTTGLSALPVNMIGKVNVDLKLGPLRMTVTMFLSKDPQPQALLGTDVWGRMEEFSIKWTVPEIILRTHGQVFRLPLIMNPVLAAYCARRSNQVCLLADEHLPARSESLVEANVRDSDLSTDFLRGAGDKGV